MTLPFSWTGMCVRAWGAGRQSESQSFESIGRFVHDSIRSCPANL